MKQEILNYFQEGKASLLEAAKALLEDGGYDEAHKVIAILRQLDYIVYGSDKRPVTSLPYNLDPKEREMALQGDVQGAIRAIRSRLGEKVQLVDVITMVHEFKKSHNPKVADGNASA